MSVFPIRMAPRQLVAIEAGTKTVTRRLVTAGNSVVRPGNFANLQLRMGKVSQVPSISPRGNALQWAIRIPCRMPAGHRTVSVCSRVAPGDLLWTRQGQSGLAAMKQGSRFTLLVEEVRPHRMLDITLEDVRGEGFDAWNEYQQFWRDTLTAASFAANPWVWQYRFTTMPINIEDYLTKPTEQEIQ